MVYPATIIRYPNRIDKNASGWSVSGEYFNVPGSSPYSDYLDHIPYGTATTYIYASGGAPYTQTTSSTPAAGQFYVDYSTGMVVFNLANAGAAVEARYVTLGDDIMASHINNMQDEVYGIETNMGRGVNGAYVDLATRLDNMTASFAPGGGNTTIQYNNAGVFAGDSDLTWNPSTNDMTVNGDMYPNASGLHSVGDRTTAWNTGSFDNLFCKYIYGNGSFLTGRGAIGYTHTQTVASDSWLVQHNLGTTDVIVQVEDDATPRNLLIPQNVEFTDDNSTTITFPTPVAGEAIIISASGAMMSGASGVSQHSLLTDLNWSIAGHIMDDNILPNASGVRDIGSSSLAWDDIYANSVYANEGHFIDMYATTYYGDGSNLTNVSTWATPVNSNIVPDASGTRDIGSQSLTFNNIYSENVYSDDSFETSDSGAFYFGDPNTDGTWRFIRAGVNLVAQRRESASWVTKAAFLA